MSPSAAPKATLFKRLVLILAALQVIAVATFIQSFAAGDESWTAGLLWVLGGAWVWVGGPLFSIAARASRLDSPILTGWRMP